MRKILSILGVTAAVGIAVLAGGSANAAPGPNHGQCVSGAVKAGVTGDAFTAIAQNNALVGTYGSTTCPAIVVAPAPDLANSTQDMAWDYSNDYVHITGTFTFNVDKDGNGSFHYAASDGNTIDGVATSGTFVKTGTTATFAGTVTASTGPDAASFLNKPFTVVAVDNGATGDQIGLFVDRPYDGNLATVTGGNLTVF